MRGQTLPPRGARIVVSPSYLSALGGERLLADVDGRFATFLDEGFDRLAALRVAYFRHGDAWHAYDAAAAVDRLETLPERPAAFVAVHGRLAVEGELASVRGQARELTSALAALAALELPPFEWRCAAFRAIVGREPRAFTSEIGPASLVAIRLLGDAADDERGWRAFYRMARKLADALTYALVCACLVAMAGVRLSVDPRRLLDCVTNSAFASMRRQLVGKLAALGGAVQRLAAQLGDTWVRAALESEYLRCAVLLLVSAVASGVEATGLAATVRDEVAIAARSAMPRCTDLGLAAMPAWLRPPLAAAVAAVQLWHMALELGDDGVRRGPEGVDDTIAVLVKHNAHAAAVLAKVPPAVAHYVVAALAAVRAANGPLGALRALRHTRGGFVAELLLCLVRPPG
jgi:hypothetical protein